MRLLCTVSLLLAGLAACAGPKIVGMPANEFNCNLLVCDNDGVCQVVGEPGGELCHAMLAIAEEEADAE